MFNLTIDYSHLLKLNSIKVFFERGLLMELSFSESGHLSIFCYMSLKQRTNVNDVSIVFSLHNRFFLNSYIFLTLDTLHTELTAQEKLLKQGNQVCTA